MNFSKKRSISDIPAINLKTPKKEVNEQRFDCTNEKNPAKTKTDPEFNSDRLITGTVNFILKIHKLYPDIFCFFEVYGSLVKLIPGKYSGQNILILKNVSGPVLQGIYYKFDENDLINVKNGELLCCVGRFLNSTKNFHIFKLNVITKFPTECTFSRIQSICNYSLSSCYKKSIN